MRQRVSAYREAELGVLQFLVTHKGICTVAVWQDFAGVDCIKQRTLERLIRRGDILAPQPGELYLLSEGGHRRLESYRKKSSDPTGKLRFNDRVPFNEGE